MREALEILHNQTAMLFAATILFAAIFLIARIGRARQSIAFAFAFMPLLAAWALIGLTG